MCTHYKSLNLFFHFIHLFYAYKKSDDMGLGKTLQALIGIAIAHCNHKSNDHKSLIICPTTVSSVFRKLDSSSLNFVVTVNWSLVLGNTTVFS